MGYSKKTVKYREKLMRSIKSDVAKMNKSAHAIGISGDEYLEANISTFNTLTKTKDMKMFRAGNLSKMSTKDLERLKEVSGGYLKRDESTLAGRKRMADKLWKTQYDKIKGKSVDIGSVSEARRMIKKMASVQKTDTYKYLKARGGFDSAQLMELITEYKCSAREAVNIIEDTDEIMKKENLGDKYTMSVMEKVFELRGNGIKGNYEDNQEYRDFINSIKPGTYPESDDNKDPLAPKMNEFSNLI